MFFEYRVTDPVGEILKGIRCYFDRALPVMLLYKKERKQYLEAVVGDVSPSTIYGAEHLLRLFGMITHKCQFLKFVCYYSLSCLDHMLFLAFYVWWQLMPLVDSGECVALMSLALNLNIPSSEKA